MKRKREEKDKEGRETEGVREGDIIHRSLSHSSNVPNSHE